MSKSTASILIDAAVATGDGWTGLVPAVFQDGYSAEAFKAIDALSKSVKLHRTPGTPGPHVEGDLARAIARVGTFDANATYTQRTAAIKRAVKKVYA